MSLAILWVQGVAGSNLPKEARWQHLKAKAPQPTIGTLVDDAMSGNRALLAPPLANKCKALIDGIEAAGPSIEARSDAVSAWIAQYLPSNY